jgi:hypothetical protein
LISQSRGLGDVYKRQLQLTVSEMVTNGTMHKGLKLKIQKQSEVLLVLLLG